MPNYELVKIGASPNWYIQWFEDGHSQRASTRTADRSQAEAVKRAFILEKEEGPGESVTVSEVLDWYWEAHAKDLKRPDNPEAAIKHLKAFFGATLAADCGVKKQQAYVDHRRRAGATVSLIRRDLQTFSAALNRAAKYEQIAKAPPIMAIPTLAPRERWLTRQEVAKLFRALRTKRRRHLLLFARLAMWTGQRSGAILNLHKDRVLFDYDLIEFRRPGDSDNKKAILAPLPPHLKKALQRACERSKTGFVIEYAGERPERVVRGFKRAAVEAGLGKNVSPHTLRHSFATWATLKGHALHDTGKALGQSVQATTARYAHIQTAAVARVQDSVRRK